MTVVRGWLQRGASHPRPMPMLSGGGKMACKRINCPMIRVSRWSVVTKPANNCVGRYGPRNGPGQAGLPGWTMHMHAKGWAISV